jgi:uncharacterized protein YigA (DUF484 family)
MNTSTSNETMQQPLVQLTNDLNGDLSEILQQLEEIARYLEVAVAALDGMEAGRGELVAALSVIIDREALAPVRTQMVTLERVLRYLHEVRES